MPPKKKVGRLKKEMKETLLSDNEKGSIHFKQDDSRNPFNKRLDAPAPPVQESGEDMSDFEADAMISRAEEKKQAETDKVEKSVDVQEWTKQDPIIPEELEGRVWVAVYRCPDNHKTKATNRQADKGVLCYECKGFGKQVTAVIVPQFLKKPQEEKRKKL